MQADRQERLETHQPTQSLVRMRVPRFNTRRQGDTIEERVQSQSERDTHPPQHVARRFTGVRVAAAGRVMIVVMVVIVFMHDFESRFPGDMGLGRAMLVKVERSNEEKHAQQSHRRPERGSVDADLVGRMRQHVKQADTEHQSGDKAHQNLHPRVRQPHTRGEPATSNRGSGDRDGVAR